MAFPLTELGEKIFLDRYALKDMDRKLEVGDTVLVITDKDTGQREIGEVGYRVGPNINIKFEDRSTKNFHIDQCERPIETPADAAWRVANAVASAESPDNHIIWRNKFMDAMNDWKFIPAGRIWAGAGDPERTYFNCYVLPSPHDSRGGIIDTFRQMTEIMSRGGGVGINLSTLRPRKAIVRGVNGRSSGAVSWGGLYSYGTGLIEQGGSRRGALMLILEDWHPDILEFIDAKKEAGKITNANISVGISDEFMTAVANNDVWDLVFPDTSDPDYDYDWHGDIDEWENKLKRKVIVYKTVKARELWNKIVESAWASAEPGIWFKGQSNRFSNSFYYPKGKLQGTNPCGEQPLPEWGVCNLGAINLSKFVKDGGVDWSDLGDTVATAIRFLDDVIDTTPYFYYENERQQKAERRIGLNTMGLADMLIQLGIRYGSDESITFIDDLYSFIARKAYSTSSDLAVEKGKFPLYKEDILNSGYMRQLPEYLRLVIKRQGLRNVTLLTQAPNGTIGTMVGTSTGIEPFFSFKWFRKSRLGVHEENMEIAQEWLQNNPGKVLPEYFVTAMQLSPREHVQVQAAIQRWVDSAISKTVNCPNDYTIDQVAEVYELMYELGCKGGTIYRDNSRTEQVLIIPEGEECPTCHEKTLIKESGCETCSNCGYSVCKL